MYFMNCMKEYKEELLTGDVKAFSFGGAADQSASRKREFGN